MPPPKTITLALAILIVIQGGTLLSSELQVRFDAGQIPKLIRQGPIGIQQQTTTDYYWFQAGAIGDSSSDYHSGANVTIRTVYDQVNNDGHSYWVGGYLSNGAFIQVGFLNEVSTTNRPYCCAWFFEYFPAGQTECCAPVVGRAGSAGPIGSWHTYSMVHSGSGVWSFYMDEILLGSTPNLGATDSGQHAPAAIAEVAQATSNSDVLGPGEFKGLWYRDQTGGIWTRVPAANTLIWYGAGTPSNRPANPYGVVEVTGVDNSFLAGSQIPQLSPPSPPPQYGPALWPTTIPSYQFSMTFLDMESGTFRPEWVSLYAATGGGHAFYTDSHDYQNLRVGSGNWFVDRVMWHTVNVATLQGTAFPIPGQTSVNVETTVSSMRLKVVGAISGLPVTGAHAITFLPDTTNATAKTDSTGLVVLAQLPPGTYNVRITVPYGLPALASHDLQQPGEFTARVFGPVEMLVIIFAPISLAVVAVVVAVRKERQRALAMPTIPPYITLTGNCQSCGAPLRFVDQFCPSCGRPLRQTTSPVQGAASGQGETTNAPSASQDGQPSKNTGETRETAQPSVEKPES